MSFVEMLHVFVDWVQVTTDVLRDKTVEEVYQRSVIGLLHGWVSLSGRYVINC